MKPIETSALDSATNAHGGTRILRLPAVSARTGYRKSSIYTKMKEGTFPTNVKLGSRAVGWIESEIEAHNQACIDASRPDDSE